MIEESEVDGTESGSSRVVPAGPTGTVDAATNSLQDRVDVVLMKEDMNFEQGNFVRVLYSETHNQTVEALFKKGDRSNVLTLALTKGWMPNTNKGVFGRETEYEFSQGETKEIRYSMGTIVVTYHDGQFYYCNRPDPKKEPKTSRGTSGRRPPFRAFGLS